MCKVTVASVLALFLLNLQVSASEASSSPYSGQETREIKALSDSDISGLLAGKGMGFAKAAELNGYPGPAHVLELADELGLSDVQRAKTRAIFDRMQDSAKELGAELVAAERTLDTMFRNRTITESSLSELVNRIGVIRARLRAVHLHAHLEERRVLSKDQVAKYMTLRGYESGDHIHYQHHHGN